MHRITNRIRVCAFASDLLQRPVVWCGLGKGTHTHWHIHTKTRGARLGHRRHRLTINKTVPAIGKALTGISRGFYSKFRTIKTANLADFLTHWCAVCQTDKRSTNQKKNRYIPGTLLLQPREEQTGQWHTQRTNAKAGVLSIGS